MGVVALIGAIFLFRRRQSHMPVAQTDIPDAPSPSPEQTFVSPMADVKIDQYRPLSELEGTKLGRYYDHRVSGDQGTPSNWGTNSATLMISEVGHVPRSGSDRVHELG